MLQKPSKTGDTSKQDFGQTVSVLVNTTAKHALPIYLSLASNALKRQVDGEDVSSIVTSSQPFPLSQVRSAPS